MEQTVCMLYVVHTQVIAILLTNVHVSLKWGNRSGSANGAIHMYTCMHLFNQKSTIKDTSMG